MCSLYFDMTDRFVIVANSVTELSKFLERRPVILERRPECVILERITTLSVFVPKMVCA